MVKSVVITGVSGGIGLALAGAYQAKGHRVAGIDLDPCPLSLDVFVQGDLAEKAVLEGFAARVLQQLQGVDVLIHNAMASQGGVFDCSYEGFIRAQKVGLAAPFYLTKLLMDGLRPGAAILMLSSTRAFQSQANTESYAAAKGGISGLTHALAISLGGRARVNAIAPGWIDTTGQAWQGPDASQHPVGRVGHPRDIVEAALFLCSKEAGFITGQTLVVDGGMSVNMVYHGDGGWVYQG